MCKDSIATSARNLHGARNPGCTCTRGFLKPAGGNNPPRYLKDYGPRIVMLPDIVAERAGVGWYRKLAGPLRTVTVHAAFLPPQTQ